MKLFGRKKIEAEEDSLETSSPPATSSTRKIFPAGIKLLHSPANPADAVIDIVFVHGLTGDREKTWTAADASEPWPKALLPSKVPTARVLTFGYDAYVADWRSVVSQNRIANHAWNLLTSLAAYREEDDTNERPIIFVCHSLGGLVCEDALFTSRQRPEPHLQNILQSTRNIAFLGTPHHGAGLARWAKLLSISIGVIKQTNTEIVAVLKSDSEVLARIQDGFHAMLQSRAKENQPIEISCFYEQLPLIGVGQVVPQDSAIIPGSVPIGIRANHMDMTKFATVHDPGFVALCGELLRWTKQLSKTSNPSGNLLPPGSGSTLPGVQRGPDGSQSYAGILEAQAVTAPASNHVNPTAGFNVAGWTILHAAVRSGDLEGTRCALEAGHDPNKATDKELWTPLWVAACFGHSVITRILLKAGANANAVTQSGSTAMREAAMIGSTEVLTLLIAKGVNLEVCPPETGDTPLICAAAKGNLEAVEILVQAGANVDAQQYGGWSALHYALQGRNERMVRMLLQHSPDSNISTETGVRPLHLAAVAGLTSMVGELLTHGAEIDAEDCHGLTPLLVAVQGGNLETIQMLVSRGAKTTITDDQGHSLLDIARILGHTNIYLWLEQQSIS